MSNITTLDELFAEVKPFLAPKPKGTKRISDVDKINPDELFTKPENWLRGVTVILIHEESATVLGTFIEWLHKTEANCRRLVRTEELAAVARTERVSGDWWIAEHHEITAPQSWHTKRSLIVPLHLEKLGVHSPTVEVVVSLAYGSIARVELAADEQFAQTAGVTEQLLWLPAGANILPLLSRDAKISIKVELERADG